VIEFVILILLTTSVFANIFFFSYVRFLLEQLSFVSENINSLVGSVVSLRNHLSDVYELERFYGDPTLEGLLRHTSAVADMLQDFEHIYMLVDDETDEEEESLLEESEEADDTETT
tara:strand:- start:36 stop:383 length:348 start_codon:yes stop_codon:yes gene_type:complete